MKFFKGIISALVCIAFTVFGAFAQNNGPLLTTTDYVRYNAAIEYKLFQKGIGTQLVKPGDFIYMHSVQKLGDSSAINTYRDNAGKPILNPVQGTGGITDFSELIFKMHEGDSLIVKLNTDTVFKNATRPPYMRFGDELIYMVKVERIATEAEVLEAKNKAVEMQNKSDDNERKVLLETLGELKAQAKKEDAEIVKYLKQNKITATKTNGGAYYYFINKGKGNFPMRGVTAVVNYTGKIFPSMKAFDSNVDPKFKHEMPFGFVVGSGTATPGWEEIIPQIPVGSKIVMILPSQSAYGIKGGGTVIPPNTMLLYEVELTGLQ
jgi:FKBP-type peptidyl-prolyl cis-trans isomerase FkpA